MAYCYVELEFFSLPQSSQVVTGTVNYNTYSSLSIKISE
jgi:hypothetical protein